MAATLKDMDGKVAELAKLYNVPLYTYDLDTMRNIAKETIRRNDLVQAISIQDQQLGSQLFTIRRDDSSLSHYKYIRKPIVYHNKLLGHITVYYRNPYDFFLSDREHNYLASHPVVTFVSDPHWPPVEFINERGVLRGISNDILQLIAEKTGIRFKWTATGSWSRSLSLVEDKKAELITAIAKNEQREKKFIFTRPYFNFPIVMVTTQDKPFINSLEDLSGKKVVAVRGYAVSKLLATHHPTLQLLQADNVQDALRIVAGKKAYTYVGILPVASYNIGKNSEFNLKIAGKTKYSLPLSLATYQGNSPELITILNKAISSLSQEEKQRIYNKWIQVQFEQETDYSLAWKILFLSIVVFIIFYYWNRKISAINQKLDEQRRIFRTIYEKSADAILLLRDGAFIDCNDAALAMLGYSDRGGVVGRHPAELSPPVQPGNRDSYRTADKMMVHAMQYGYHHFQWVHLKGDGTEFWTDVAYTHLILDNKPTIHVRWLDIQGQKELQRQLVEQRKKAIAASNAKSEFLANMSHEIRTPLNALLGMLYLTLKTELTRPQRIYLNKARNAAHSLLTIINDILDLSKIEAGKLEIEQIEFQLESVIGNLRDAMEILASGKHVQFLIRQDMDLPPVLIGDPIRLGQILINLCGNALKFTEEGEVELSLSCREFTGREITLQITVRDTGLGMDDKTREKIFEKFTQADQSTTRRFGGTGLGLAISQALVKMMGGHIWIEKTAPGQGSTFCCTLCFQVPEQEGQQPSLQEKIGSLLKGVRALIVEGHPASQAILVEIMASFQIEIRTANSGEKAISILEKTASPFDIVFLDRNISGLNGEQTAQRILDDPAIIPKPKLVLTTGYGREEILSPAGPVGFDAILFKPVTPSTLLDTILSVLGHNRLMVLERQNGYHDLPPPLPSYSGQRILIVEDNELNRDFVRELLASMGVEVDEARNGKEAIAMASSRHYELLLMDVHMPIMDGLEATREIRAKGEKSGYTHLRTLPIVALTAMAMAHDREKCLRAGMTDIITKPIDPERLISVLGKFLQADKSRLDDGSTKQSSGQSPEESGKKEEKALNTAEGIYRIGGDKNAYFKQLGRFSARYGRAVENLQQLLRKEGIKAGEEYCHALKGVFGNIGAKKLFACVCEIDEQLKKGVDPSQELFDRMRALLAEVLGEIDMLTQQTDETKSPTGTLDREQLHAQLIILKSLLRNDLGAANKLLYKIQAETTGTEAEAMVKELSQHMDLFAIDKAISTINAWCD